MGHWVSLHAALCMVMADGAHHYLLSHPIPICGPCLGHLGSSGGQPVPVVFTGQSQT